MSCPFRCVSRLRSRGMATGIGFAMTVAIASRVHAQASRAWTEPFPPFRIAGNLYYVGSKGLANYLITTPQGHILINSDLEQSVPLIRSSVEKLGSGSMTSGFCC